MQPLFQGGRRLYNGGNAAALARFVTQGGFEVVGVLCLVEREEAHGRSAVEKAAFPAPFVSLFTDNDVRQEHVQQLAAETKVTP